ncbi:trafficking protein particle complex subunit 12 [Biomphalaria pfeifferi]|uniref:Trafficking protein particle complex subunit 12 n=1 Tax=Biomphalaria pfeifferi TaxID=112525 RepID=A0AAD8FM03_BIOPF|nr:trafficking protein particle complex subunit 12 [Biomphalaria pfeifferi]
MSSPVDDCMLEDDEDDSGHLQPPFSSLSSAMVSSPTTDTLDSVILEASAFDEVIKHQDGNDQLSLEETVDLGPPDERINISKTGFGENNKEKVMSASIIDQGINNFHSFEQKPAANVQHSSISSYFANSGDDIFDTIATVHDDSSLGSDLFLSIAISKSEEDIRTSEMNAIEIKDSDVVSCLSPDNDEGLPRQNSFMRKYVDEDEFKLVENEELKDREAEQFIEIGTSAVKISDEDEEAFGDTEIEAVDVIHTPYQREHKSSTCEPETIAFEGELELGENKQVDLEIADLEEEDIEEFTQNDDKPGFMSQISRSSEPNTDVSQNSCQIPQQPTSILNPPVESSLGKHHGPVVGTTPSQLSPMGTPVHQASDSNPDILTSSPPLMPINPPVFDSQPVPQGSPFHLPSPEIKSGAVFSQFGPSGTSEDAFTSILSMSDADRRHDAWIPSDATSHVLKLMATSAIGSYIPATEHLSTPGIISNEPMGDPVKDLVLRYMGEQEAVKRSVLTCSSVTQDADGLKKLIEAGCLRAAVDLTGRLLEQVGQGYDKLGCVTVHTPHSLQLWFCRLAMMVKLRMYEQAEAEMRAFQTLDTPDLYFQFYANTYPGRRGSMVSFSMRLLHAELPLLCGRSQESLDRLYYILAVCKRIRTNLSSDLSEDGSATHMTYEARKVSLELWTKRETDVTYKIASTMLSVKDYEGALDIYNTLLDKDKNSHLELLAGIGRIHLQMGNITEATRILKEVETESSKIDSSVTCHTLISRGLLAMCAANFYDAYQHFKSAVQMQPHNTCAVNNMAVCSLYLGRLKDALNTLEQLVHSDPANTLHEGVLFNLCTLYELETSRALHKKQAILDLVSKHKGDGFPVACLKMT